MLPNNNVFAKSIKVSSDPHKKSWCCCWDLCLIDHENAFDIKSFILIGLIKILFTQLPNTLTKPHPMIEIRFS